jgi:hypothetical protein
VNVLRGSYGVFRESKREEDPSNCSGLFQAYAVEAIVMVLVLLERSKKFK